MRVRLWAALFVSILIALSAAALPQLFTTGGAKAFDVPQSGFYLAVDCDLTTAGVQDNCNLPSGTASRDVGLVLGNVDVAGADLAAFNFELTANQLVLDPLSTNNPEFNASLEGTWACSPPAPNPDSNADPAVAVSFLSCFWSGGTVQALPPATELLLATVHYDVVGDGASDLAISNVSIGDVIGNEIVTCPGPCFDGVVSVGPPTPTITPTHTATAVPPTNTPCPDGICPPTATQTPLAFVTVTPSPSPTNTATSTPASQPTNTPTRTPTTAAAATNTPTATPTNTVAAPTSTSTPTPAPGGGEQPCMTVGEKVSLAVGIATRAGAVEGERRYKSRYDLNRDSIIGVDDLALVVDTPVCVRGRSGLRH